jgi:hypothetical protein
MAADACPSIRCTLFTLAPALTARHAAVCLLVWCQAVETGFGGRSVEDISRPVEVPVGSVRPGGEDELIACLPGNLYTQLIP